MLVCYAECQQDVECSHSFLFVTSWNHSVLVWPLSFLTTSAEFIEKYWVLPLGPALCVANMEERQKTYNLILKEFIISLTWLWLYKTMPFYYAHGPSWLPENGSPTPSSHPLLVQHLHPHSHGQLCQGPTTLIPGPCNRRHLLIQNLLTPSTSPGNSGSPQQQCVLQVETMGLSVAVSWS